MDYRTAVILRMVLLLIIDKSQPHFSQSYDCGSDFPCSRRFVAGRLEIEETKNLFLTHAG